MHLISPKINLAEAAEWVQMLKEDTEKCEFPEALKKKKKMDRQDETLHMLSLQGRTERVLLSVNAKQPTRERNA